MNGEIKETLCRLVFFNAIKTSATDKKPKNYVCGQDLWMLETLQYQERPVIFSHQKRKPPSNQKLSFIGYSAIKLQQIEKTRASTKPSHPRTNLASTIPHLRILNRPLPIRRCQKPALSRRHKPQRKSNASPQPLQFPMQSKRRAKTNGHRHHIITNQINIPTYLLISETAEETIAVCC